MSKKLNVIALAVAALALTASVQAIPPAQELADFLGAWNVEAQMQGNTVTMVVTFAQGADGALSGTWESPRGSTDLQDLEYADGKLTFTRTMGQGGGGGGGGTMANEATLQDGKLHLKISTPNGDRELVGTRKES